MSLPTRFCLWTGDGTLARRRASAFGVAADELQSAAEVRVRREALPGQSGVQAGEARDRPGQPVLVAKPGGEITGADYLLAKPCSRMRNSVSVDRRAWEAQLWVSRRRPLIVAQGRVRLALRRPPAWYARQDFQPRRRAVPILIRVAGCLARHVYLCDQVPSLPVHSSPRPRP